MAKVALQCSQESVTGLALFWDWWIYSISSYTITLRSILILSFELQLNVLINPPLCDFPQNFVCVPLLFCSFLMSHPSHTPWFTHPNIIWWVVQFIMQFSPYPWYSLSLTPKHPESKSFPYDKGQKYTQSKTRGNINFMYFNF